MANHYSGKKLRSEQTYLILVITQVANVPRAAVGPDWIPKLIKQGYGAICVGFDTAALARFFDGGLKSAREFAQQIE
jgi:hypothetical protein